MRVGICASSVPALRHPINSALESASLLRSRAGRKFVGTGPNPLNTAQAPPSRRQSRERVFGGWIYRRVKAHISKYSL